jgi:hypothetical protein
MARDVITSTKLAKNTDIAPPAGVAINTTNNAQVVFVKPRKTIIIVTNTSASGRVVTVKKATAAQDIPAADYSTAAIPATTGVGVLGPFDGRYIQPDGSIFLDYVAGHTGVAYAYELP